MTDTLAGQAHFTGYAVVEIMGHQHATGWVTTEYFGGVAMLHVILPGETGQEETLMERRWLEGEYLYPGSVIRTDRLAVDEWVGAGSIYRLRPCSEAAALSRQPRKIEILSRAGGRGGRGSVSEIRCGARLRRGR
jgi:hypothetical protein